MVFATELSLASYLRPQSHRPKEQSVTYWHALVGRKNVYSPSSWPVVAGCHWGNQATSRNHLAIGIHEQLSNEQLPNEQWLPGGSLTVLWACVTCALANSFIAIPSNHSRISWGILTSFSHVWQGPITDPSATSFRVPVVSPVGQYWQGSSSTSDTFSS